MRDTFLSILMVAVIVLIIVYKLFTGIMNTNEAMIDDQEIAASATEITSNSVTEITTKKQRKITTEATNEATTNDYETLKYNVLDDIDKCQYNILAYFDELVSADEMGATGYYRVANDILDNSSMMYPNYKYEEYGGTYYKLIQTLHTQLINAADSIVKMYDKPDKQIKYQVEMEDSLAALKYGITLIEDTRTEWLKECGWFTEEEIGWLTSE